MAYIWQNNGKAIAEIWSWCCPSEVGQNVSMEELGQNVAAKKCLRGKDRIKCLWDKMSPNPYQTYHCFHNCWCHLVVELDTCACLWRCFLDIGEKAKYICGKQIGTSGRWMGCWRQIGEKAPNKLEQYRRSCIHTEALLEIFMVNKSTLYSDVMAPNMLARPLLGQIWSGRGKDNSISCGHHFPSRGSNNQQWLSP